ncbi:MAG: threonine--tRNA ligase [Clostridia bacterium]|nr:threonine--tRNA ligase [Clostridia bacterium]
MKILYKDGTVAECPQEEELQVLRHSTAHVMAQAIKRLYPHADFAFGPATEKGFFYDVDLGDTKLTDEDLARIEAEMKKIVKENLPVKAFILPREEAIKLMQERGEKYKVEHIDDLGDDAVISFYQQGEYIDMCTGPHVTYTKALKAFKITQQSGAYWKNDKNNKMLTRINGVAFRTQEELAEFERMQEEAKARDHRKIGKDMKLFMTDDLIGKGLPMFLPNGYEVWQQLETYIKEKERKLGYLHVLTPCVGTVNLYRTSGHWEHYRANMFPMMQVEDEEFVLRPMNCPHHMMIYANQKHSYKDLPIRIGEIAHDFRFEQSGTLKGIERGRHFCQNDAHLFVTPEQIKDEVGSVVNLIFDVYKDFNITNYRCVLSLRDPADTVKYHQDDAMWEKAESALREVLTELGVNFTEEIGEAAFYGPKLDVNVQPAIGAEYTLSTCQLDFCLPAKFNLTYVDKDGTEKTPVVLHRAILGSLDRFMAYLIEETKGIFPLWLAPLQVKILTLPNTDTTFANEVYDKLFDAGVRVKLDDRNETIGYKIREARQQDRATYMVIVGAKEIETHTISVRELATDKTTSYEVDEFIQKVVEAIKERK